MYKMDSLDFFGAFATVQATNRGVGSHVKPIQLQRATKLSRTAVYHHLSRLIERGWIKRLKHGQYAIIFGDKTASIGASVLTAWDMMEYVREPNSWLKQFNLELEEYQS